MVNFLSKFSVRLAKLCILGNVVTGNKHDWYWGKTGNKLLKRSNWKFLKHLFEVLFISGKCIEFWQTQAKML